MLSKSVHINVVFRRSFSQWKSYCTVQLLVFSTKCITRPAASTAFSHQSRRLSIHCDVTVKPVLYHVGRCKYQFPLKIFISPHSGSMFSKRLLLIGACLICKPCSGLFCRVCRPIFRPPVYGTNGRSYKMLVMFFFFFYFATRSPRSLGRSP